MKQLLLWMLPALVVFSSCDNYGKKLAVGESEVFYKGEGVTPKDAEALGEFLMQNELFSKDEKRSAQLVKDGDRYLVNLVVDKKNAAPSLRLTLWKLQNKLANEVFAGADTRFVFTDDTFQNGDVLDATSVVKLGRASVYYDSEAFKAADAKALGELLQAKGMLTDEKDADVLVRNEGNEPLIRVIVDKAYMEENLELVLPAFGFWQHLVQKELSPFKNAKMMLTSTTYEDYKKVPELTAEEIAEFEKAFSNAAAEPTASSNAATPETDQDPADQDQQ